MFAMAQSKSPTANRTQNSVNSVAIMLNHAAGGIKIPYEEGCRIILPTQQRLQGVSRSGRL